MRRLAIDAVMHYNPTLLTDLDYASATWTPGKCKNVNINLETNEADVTERGALLEEILEGLQRASLEVECVFDPDNPFFAALRSAWVNKSGIALAAMDKPVTEPPAEGLAGNFSVLNYTRSETLGEALMATFTIKPRSFASYWELTA